MKVQVEIDCTPEEARRFLGLPDVSKANDVYIDAIAKAMQGVESRSAPGLRQADRADGRDGAQTVPAVR
jgi:hypothetical protein